MSRVAGQQVPWLFMADMEEKKTTHTNPERVWIGKEMQSAAETAIDGLTPVVRQALLLNTLKWHDYHTVSALIGCPIGTVRSRIFRAREVVSAALAEE